jgi:hypothetical protein
VAADAVHTARLVRTDLLEAQASIDWPSSQFLSFHARLEKWIKANVHIEIRSLDPPAEHNRVVAVEKEFLPLVFSVEAGAYINAIRSSLDILAMALVHRHAIKINERKVEFPIFGSETAFREHNGGMLLQRLPEKQRAIIEALKPYPEGNPALWALHKLDIERKHKRLLNVRPQPIHMSMEGTLKPGDFVPLGTGTIQVNDETVLGLLRKGVPEPAIRSSFYVALSEPDYVGRKPVLATLIHLAECATDVIHRFDD